MRIKEVEDPVQGALARKLFLADDKDAFENYFKFKAHLKVLITQNDFDMCEIALSEQIAVYQDCIDDCRQIDPSERPVRDMKTIIDQMKNDLSLIEEHIDPYRA